MTDLLNRIAVATGPDRELDADIDALAGWRRLDNPTAAGGLIDMWHRPDGSIGRRDERLHAYTASIDAALTLLPEGEGRWPQLTYISPNPNNKPDGHRWEIWMKGVRKPIKGRSQHSAALALLSAILKARGVK